MNKLLHTFVVSTLAISFSNDALAAQSETLNLDETSVIAPLLAYPHSITSATKTDTRLMETPVSIQVRSQSLMLEQNLVQLRSAVVLRLKNISFGVNQPRHFLGLLLSKCIAFSISSFLILLKLCCLEKNWRNKSLVFSLGPRCQDTYGLAK